MPAGTVGSRLATLTLIDPQRDPSWSHVRVPAAAARELPSTPRRLGTELTGAVVVKTSRWPYDEERVDRRARDLSYRGLHALLDLLDRPDLPATSLEKGSAP